MRTNRLAPLAGFSILLVVVASVYYPGLKGGFHLDDANNLALLGAYGGVHDLTSLAYYLTSGFADPTGRPISMLSFLVDSRDWPAPARGFKETNLLLHLANGSLLFLLIWRIETRLDESPRAPWIAMMAAGLWLAHPLWTSTTLYVVQRHAMLPVLFGLMALIAWDLSWSAAASGRERAAWIIGIVGVLGFIALATLSKPNGILIAGVGLVLTTIAYPRIAPADRRATSRRLALLVLGGPTALCAIWLLAQFAHGLDFQGSRAWTLEQRLLTEPRVLFGYLHQLFWPSPNDPSLFSDSVSISTSLLKPWSTALSLTGIVACAMFVAFGWRQMPRTAVALGGFLVAHTMESGPVMLELAFDHRNYLPSLFLFWPCAYAFCCLRLTHAVRISLGIAALAVLSSMTHVGAKRWGDPDWVSPHLAEYALRSPRSAAQLVEKSFAAQGQEVGRRVAHEMSSLHPDDLALSLLRVEVECLTGELSNEAAGSAEHLLGQQVVSDLGLLQSWLDAMAEFQITQRCPGLDAAVFHRWVQAVIDNPRATTEPRNAQVALRVLGSWQLRSGDDAGAASIQRSVALSPRPHIVLLAAATLAEAAAFQSALAILAMHPPGPETMPSWAAGMQRLHEELLHRTGYWEKEYSALRELIEIDARADAATESAMTPSSDNCPVESAFDFHPRHF